MKIRYKSIAIFLILFAMLTLGAKKISAQEEQVSFQVFYDELSPYGTWINFPVYGYVWVPDVSSGFVPYGTNGYWVYTDEGWTWVSNYPWGWAPFHYGRWYTDVTYGPVWIPGYEWGPAWVTWRRSNDYYCWAPLGPGISIDIAFGGGYHERYNQYVVVGCNHFGRNDMDNYYSTNYSYNTTIINNTTVINNVHRDKSFNISYNSGPDRFEVEKRSGRTVMPVKIKEMDHPGQSISGNQYAIYRPHVMKQGLNGQKPAPSRVSNIKDVKTIKERSSNVINQNTNQGNKQLPNRSQFNNQQNKQQSGKTQPNNQQNKQQPGKTQPNNQQNKQQPIKTQPSNQQNRQQPVKTQPNNQQNKQQPIKNQPNNQQNRQQPVKTQPNNQQSKQQSGRTQSNIQQNKQQPVRLQPNSQQTKPQPDKMQPGNQQNKQQPVK